MRELGWLEGSFLSSDLTIVAVATIDGILEDSILRKCCLTPATEPSHCQSCQTRLFQYKTLATAGALTAECNVACQLAK